MPEPIDLHPWETVEFPWGVGVRHRNGRWETVILKPTGFEIDVSKLIVNLTVLGIEFEGWEKHE